MITNKGKNEVLNLVPVTIQDAQVDDDGPAIPSELLEGAELYDSNLPPSPLWETPGQYLEGIYLGSKSNVGKNHQMLYSFYVSVKGGITKEVAVWGSTSLNDRMRMASPKNGDHVLIVYKGETPTSRNEDPLKLFAVIIKRKN